MNTQGAKLTLRTWTGLLTLGLSLWLIITQLEMIMEMIWVLLGALLIGLTIRPVAGFLTRWRIPRGFTVLGAYMIVVALLVLLGVLLVPIISAEISQLQANGPALLQKALSQVTAIPVVNSALPSSDTLVQSLAQRMGTVVNAMASAVAGLGTLTVDVLVALIIGYFFATDVDLFERLSVLWIPQHHRARIRLAVAHLQRQLTRWVWARLIVAVYFGVVSGAGLALFGVPFALTISLVGALLEIVPYLGGAAVPLAAASALTMRPISALWIVLFYVAVIEIKGHVIEPALYGRAMGLHPGVVLVALMVGLKVGGVIGVLFAVPVTVVLVAVLDQVRPMLLGGEAETGEQVLQDNNASG
jgi:predicted PurR-regulated permease PerM